MTDLTVTVNKTIHGSIEKVFDAWLNPKMLSKFMMPMPGMPDMGGAADFADFDF